MPKSSDAKRGRPKKQFDVKILDSLFVAGFSDRKVAEEYKKLTQQALSYSTVRRIRDERGWPKHKKGGPRSGRFMTCAQDEYTVMMRQQAIDCVSNSMDAGLRGPWPGMTATAWLQNHPSLWENRGGKILRVKPALGAPAQLR